LLQSCVLTSALETQHKGKDVLASEVTWYVKKEWGWWVCYYSGWHPPLDRQEQRADPDVSGTEL